MNKQEELEKTVCKDLGELSKTEERELTKKEIEKCRHKSEKRWYRGLCVINVLIIFLLIASIITYLPEKISKINDEIMQEIMQEMNEEAKVGSASEDSTEDSTEDAEMEEIETEILMYSICALGIMVALPLLVNFYYQKYRAMSIRITQKNFPEIYERVQLYAKRMGLRKVPEVYIIQQNGALNAFASFIVRKQYIEIYADIFEVAYLEYKDLETISFILAHEMAHVRYKHATFGYMFKILFSRIIPILGSTASRAREYSCDRLAQKVTGNDGIEAMFSLMAGKHLYKVVDKEDYLEYAKSVKGFFVWCANLTASHPVMTKRILALEMGEGNGELY